MKNKKLSKAGFTLLEILIAVLIIGVLTTIALPMYQGAVDKSKWARLIAPARAVSTAQEAAFMNYGGYTANMDDLDVSLPEGNDMTYTLYTTTNGDDANFIRIVSSQLNDVRLAKYYKNNEGFEDQLYCEAKNGNDRANKLCGKLLKGQELISTDDDYKMYLVEERANEVLCNRMELWWSKNFTNCYLTEEKRCTDNNMPYSGGLCGWTNTQNQTINEGGTCEGTGTYGCKGSTINEGGVCTGTGSYSCENSTINGGTCEGNGYAGCKGSIINDGGICGGTGNAACQYATINDGGTCETTGWHSCRYSTVNDGGVCEATGTYGCNDSTIKSGGKCVGNEVNTCESLTIEAGGTCERNAANGCSGEIYGTVVGNAGTGTRRATTFYEGAVCIGNVVKGCGSGDNRTAYNITFKSGSKCVANVSGACSSAFYEAGSCCEGKCPSTVKRPDGTSVPVERC